MAKVGINPDVAAEFLKHNEALLRIRVTHAPDTNVFTFSQCLLSTNRYGDDVIEIAELPVCERWRLEVSKEYSAYGFNYSSYRLVSQKQTLNLPMRQTAEIIYVGLDPSLAPKALIAHYHRTIRRFIRCELRRYGRIPNEHYFDAPCDYIIDLRIDHVFIRRKRALQSRSKRCMRKLEGEAKEYEPSHPVAR